MRDCSAKILHLLLGAIIGCLVFGCSNSEGTYLTISEDSISGWEEPIASKDVIDYNDSQYINFFPAEESLDDVAVSSSSKVIPSSSSKVINYLPIDDTEYPYAGIPRIVIETENYREIRDRETEIPAKLQIWGEHAPESEIMDLTIRGRGNTSWDAPKTSFKIEFINKQEMLGMPKDRDWALITNYADKTLMRNYIAYKISSQLDTYYAPHCKFVELYLNREYLGVYLFTETIKISKKRVNIPKNDYSYIVEFDGKYKDGEQVIFSDILRKEKAFRIHTPKNATQASLDSIQSFIESFEEFLKNIKDGEDNNVEKWIDIDESIKYYWIQEFSKNPDTGIYNRFYTSVYFSLVLGEKIKMGPIWDFDLAFGNHPDDNIDLVKNWFIRTDWYYYLFKDNSFKQKAQEYWTTHHEIFKSILDSIDTVKNNLEPASKNNFKRWNILRNTEEWLLKKSYSSYDEAVDDLKNWIIERLQWIDSQL